MKKYNRTARLVTTLYLLIIFVGISMAFVNRPEGLGGVVSETSYNKLGDVNWMSGIAAILNRVVISGYLLLPIVLFQLIQLNNKNRSLIMLLCAMVSLSIMYVNLHNHTTALFILENGIGDEALAQLSLGFYTGNNLFLTIFFGFWLFPLILKVFKPSLIPIQLFVLLVVGFIGHLIDFTLHFVAPEYTTIVKPGLAIASIAEFSFCLWILLRNSIESKNNINMSVLPVLGVD